MVIELARMFFTFAGQHPLLIFFTAPFWFVLFISPFAIVGDIIIALIDAVTKKK